MPNWIAHLAVGCAAALLVWHNFARGKQEHDLVLREYEEGLRKSSAAPLQSEAVDPGRPRDGLRDQRPAVPVAQVESK